MYCWGAQWLSGRVLDSRPRGRGFEPHRRHCVVSLGKNNYPSLLLVQPRKTRPFITERLLIGRKESNQTLLYCITFSLTFTKFVFSHTKTTNITSTTSIFTIFSFWPNLLDRNTQMSKLGLKAKISTCLTF